MTSCNCCARLLSLFPIGPFLSFLKPANVELTEPDENKTGDSHYFALRENAIENSDNSEHNHGAIKNERSKSWGFFDFVSVHVSQVI